MVVRPFASGGHPQDTRRSGGPTGPCAYTRRTVRTVSGDAPRARGRHDRHGSIAEVERNPMGPPFTVEFVEGLNERFEHEEAPEILRWALVDSDLERVAVASSFQAEGTCVIDMAVKLRPDVPILFLETGFHFAETLAFKEQLTDRLDLNVV